MAMSKDEMAEVMAMASKMMAATVKETVASAFAAQPSASARADMVDNSLELEKKSWSKNLLDYEQRGKRMIEPLLNFWSVAKIDPVDIVGRALKDARQSAFWSRKIGESQRIKYDREAAAQVADPLDEERAQQNERLFIFNMCLYFACKIIARELIRDCDRSNPENDYIESLDHGVEKPALVDRPNINSLRKLVTENDDVSLKAYEAWVRESQRKWAESQQHKDKAAKQATRLTFGVIND